METLNLEGHPNCTTGSRVTAILLKGSILPIGEASAVEGLQSTGLHRLVNKIIALVRGFVYFHPLLPMSQLPLIWNY